MQKRIYVLRLVDDFYYVSDCDIASLDDDGPLWTMIHEPVSVAEVVTSDALFAEDTKTKEYMLRYGIGKVRGGSYTRVELTEAQVSCLVAELETATGKCYNCGHPGHFTARCPRPERDYVPPPKTECEGDGMCFYRGGTGAFRQGECAFGCVLQRCAKCAGAVPGWCIMPDELCGQCYGR